MSEDMRVQKTKKRIKSGLAELLEDYPFHELSVKMITERANLNRSTFYRNFLDKYDLLDKVMEEMLDEFEKNIDIRFIDLSEQRVIILHATLRKTLASEKNISYFGMRKPPGIFLLRCANQWTRSSINT